MDGLLTFIGTGTSMGVPMLGCGCAVCTSADARDRRMRPSVLVRWREPAGGRERVVVIDTGPDFREQALRAGLTHVDAVLYTHGHADHIMGMDDLRPLSFAGFVENGPIPLYATEATAKVLRQVFDYTFSPDATYLYRPKVTLEALGALASIHGVEFVRVPVMHGEMEISGFRFGDTAYLTDVSGIPEESLALLEGLEHLVLSALRHTPHPNHSTVEQALGWAERIGARHTWFTHIGHDLGHEATNGTLPDDVRMAYDGLTIPVGLGRAA